MDFANFKHLTIEEQNKAFVNAAVYGDIDTIKALIAIGKIDVDSQDLIGRTALIWAAKNKHSEIVSILITAGADANIEDYTGHTASMLINANPDVDKENNRLIDQKNNFPFKHHYYSPVTFSADAPLQARNMNIQATAANQDLKPKSANKLKNSNENCLVM